MAIISNGLLGGHVPRTIRNHVVARGCRESREYFATLCNLTDVPVLQSECKFCSEM